MQNSHSLTRLQDACTLGRGHLNELHTAPRDRTFSSVAFVTGKNNNENMDI